MALEASALANQKIRYRIRELPPEERAVLNGGPIPDGWLAYPMRVSPGMILLFSIIQGTIGFGGLIALVDLLINGKWSRLSESYSSGEWDIIVITILSFLFMILVITILLTFFFTSASKLVLIFKSKAVNKNGRLIFVFLLTDTHALFRDDAEGCMRVIRVARENVGKPELSSNHGHAAYTTPGGLSPSRTKVMFRFHYLDRCIEIDALSLSGNPLDGIQEWLKRSNP